MTRQNNKTFHYTVFGLGILEKVLGSKFTIQGLENIPDQPVLFVANHFTRSETFFIPYIIYKHTKRQIRCLADASLFNGVLGKFLKSLGTLSTNDKNRDVTIISDLITGDYDWMIYPEGGMIKSKEIQNHGSFITYTPYRVGPSRTGSAVLALKSELYRKALVEAQRKNKKEIINYYHNQLLTGYHPKIEHLNTFIVPLNITYYPIRPGTNKIQKIVGRFFEKLPRQIAEELEIEGNLLLSSDIHISFGQAINVASYIKNTQALVSKIPIIGEETKNNLILRYFKYRLTNNFMAEVYFSTQINFDHLFAAVIYHHNSSKINISHLKQIIILSALMIKHSKKFNINVSIEEKSIFRILDDQPNLAFDGIVNLAKSFEIIDEDGEDYLIDKDKLARKYDFHDIRLGNTIQVILNEFLLLSFASEIVKRNTLLSKEEIRNKILSILLAGDLRVFEQDYKKYYDPDLSKPKEIGSPFFLDSNLLNNPNNSFGILVCHGYLSAPAELRPMAEYFNNLGFKVYAVRLKGHGTAPINLKDVSYHDWLDSLERGYSILRTVCSRVIIVGFSTGALLALIASIEKDRHLLGIVCINPAFKLKDIRTKIVPKINLWNTLLTKLNIVSGRLEYVKNNPENSDINYSQNYLIGVEELGLLINQSRNNLQHVTKKILILQSSQDQVVSPEGAQIIFDNIASKEKELLSIDSNKHVIITGEDRQNVFEKVKLFIDSIVSV